MSDATDGEITLSTAFRPACALRCRARRSRVSLPLEFCVKDNGPGVPEDLLPHLFDPFVTTKPNGSRVSDLHWSPRSSATTAASSSASPRRAERRFAC